VVDRPIEPVRVLKSDECSVRVVVCPREPEKLWANPLASKPEIVTEAVRVLNRETCAPIVET
jgi:hypothetical protein